AVSTHWRSASVAASARWADGSAMLTMVASSAAINCASAMKASATQRRWVGCGTARLTGVTAVLISTPPPYRRDPTGEQADPGSREQGDRRRHQGWFQGHQEQNAEHDCRPGPQRDHERRIAQSAQRLV